ncbi:glycosyltransferase family 4 protein [Akkermansiaceae bacterium]|nr:glycosyltransferase family 4 protein [Akkermansiaceae bacterium]
MNEIVKYYQKVCLLAPIKIHDRKNDAHLVPIKCLNNVSVKELPFSKSYVSAVKYFFVYWKCYKELIIFDVGYVRYPVPFGWLQKVLMRKSKRIIHFVGDPIDTVKNNPNLNFLKKFLLIAFFFPEHCFYLWACRGARVYTNGNHIAERLKKYGVSGVPLISSTLSSKDFFVDRKKKINNEAPKIIYVGFLREAKGVNTVIESVCILQKAYPNAHLTIVGGGECQKDLEDLASDKGAKNIHFTGHIDSRKKLNSLLRESDIFCFASLSEGSPRVILEAMANGLNVVATPVGSLPFVFRDNVDILFAGFNDSQQFSDKMVKLLSDEEFSSEIRRNAAHRVSQFTIERFLKDIFNED